MAASTVACPTAVSCSCTSRRSLRLRSRLHQLARLELIDDARQRAAVVAQLRAQHARVERQAVAQVHENHPLREGEAARLERRLELVGQLRMGALEQIADAAARQISFGLDNAA